MEIPYVLSRLPSKETDRATNKNNLNNKIKYLFFLFNIELVLSFGSPNNCAEIMATQSLLLL